MTDFLTTIPFAGFYDSVHSQEIDAIKALMFSDPETGSDSDHLLRERFGDDAVAEFWHRLWPLPVDYQRVHEAYARHYADAFCGWLGIDGTFDELNSPREYNFTTDRVFIKIGRADLAQLWRMADKTTLTRIASDRFTSRSGFYSYYDPDWRTWGRLSDWDHNQIETLVLAAAETEQGEAWSGNAEHDLMEYARCNGAIEEWLFEYQEGDKLTRLYDLNRWMWERARKPRFTMADHVARLRAKMLPYAGTPLGQWAGA